MHRFIPLWLILIVSGCNAYKHALGSEMHVPTNAVVLPDAIESGKVADTAIVVAPMQNVEEGVFFFKDGYSTLILALAGGRYRYWFSSDITFGDEPTYPLTGRYVVDGVVVRLENSQPSMQDVWVFRKLNDQTTLWRPTAVEWWHTNRNFDSYGVLYPTKLKPEDIWQKNILKIGP